MKHVRHILVATSLLLFASTASLGQASTSGNLDDEMGFPRPSFRNTNFSYEETMNRSALDAEIQCGKPEIGIQITIIEVFLNLF